ncbi:MAG TPA: response regulator transcription factor [Terriglobales bacterium]|jgi:two-component system phosphate regulon response regulator PhoB
MDLIFLVESDLELCRTLSTSLGQAQYSVNTFFTTTDVIREAEYLRPALIIIDIALRSGNGLELCRRIRRNSFLSKTPLILLTYRSSESDRITGFDAGADDCIAKPLANGEFLARVQAVLRRYAPPFRASWDPSKDGVIQLGEIEIDSLAMRLSVRGTDVGATTLEFRLIHHLARHQGRVFTRDELLDAVWGNTEFVTPRSVDTCVRRIRKKMEVGNGSAFQLKTVRGVGYRLDAPGAAYSHDRNDSSSGGY